MKKYIEPEFEVVEFAIEDVVTASDTNIEDGGGWG